MNNKGFIATSIMYSFFIVFTLLCLSILATYTHYRRLNVKLNDRIKIELQDKIINDNPENSIICTYTSSTFANLNDHYSIGTEYICDPALDGVTYQFYILEDDGDYASLILYKNITDITRDTTKKYNHEDALTYFDDNEYFKELKWKVDVDLPSAQQIADAVGNTSFDVNTAVLNDWFYFDKYNGSYGHTQVSNATNLSDYRWLYNYTPTCSSYGCDPDTSLPSTDNYYQTKDLVSNDSTAVWYVDYRGMLFVHGKGNRDGIRPVIRLSKEQLQD